MINFQPFHASVKDLRLGNKAPKKQHRNAAPQIPASVADVLKINANGEPTLPDGRTFAQMNADIVERALAVVATVPEGAWAARLIEAETNWKESVNGWEAAEASQERTAGLLRDALAAWETDTARHETELKRLADLHRGHLRQAASGVRAAQESLGDGDIDHARAELTGVTDLLHTLADIYSEQLPGVWQQLQNQDDPVHDLVNTTNDESTGDKN